MEINITEQLLQAASSFILGTAAGFLYDFLRVIRQRARSKTVTAIADFLFWLITGLALFFLGMSLGKGQQRIFMNITAILGGVAYFCTLSRFSLILCNALADAVLFLFITLARPFIWMYLVFKKTRYFLKNIFHYQLKWYKIYADNRFRAVIKKRPRRAQKKGVVYETEKGRICYEDRDLRSDRLRLGDTHQHAGSDQHRTHQAGRARASGRGKGSVESGSPKQNRSQGR
jgi:hypothetical protein